MGAGAVDSTPGDGGETPRSGGVSTESPAAPGTEVHSLTYQVIQRHLAKLRDGARAVLDLTHLPTRAREQTTDRALADRGAVAPAEPDPSSPLAQRIERHMDRVDRVLVQIRALTPDHEKQAGLPSEIRARIAIKERTIGDIVGAELHFWAATIASSPPDEFDEVEQNWVGRMLRLADIIGVDAEHQEHLVYLKDWALHRHS